MATQVETAQREVVHLEDAHTRPMMGLDILEPLPSRSIPYEQVDPFILVHEGIVPISPERAALDTTHPHRGFDNLWYVISGEAITGHSTGPGGTFERSRLQPGSLLKLRTGRGVYHAESIGEEELREGKAGTEFRGVLFWVNLARKEKHVEPTSHAPGGRRDRPSHGGRGLSRGARDTRTDPGCRTAERGILHDADPVGLQRLRLHAGV